MTTKAQTEANRQNAKLSTGPVTPEGKKISSQNAFKFGLTSTQLIQPGENKADYEELEATLIQEWNPKTSVESAIVKEIAQSYWKLQRVRRIESRLLESRITIEHEDFCERVQKTFPLGQTAADTYMPHCLEKQSTFQVLSRYETKYERAWYRAINTLTKLQAERRKQDKENGSVSQNAQEPITLENAPPEVQKLILETSAALVKRFIEESGFVPQNSTEAAPAEETQAIPTTETRSEAA